MAHLGATRKGWQNENLASFILSKFSFIARPTSIADDIGSDFYCTLFQIRRESNRDYLIPKNSFAIQIKSNSDKFDISNKLQYLRDLELPFLVGVVDQEKLTLSIYAGEYIPMFFSHKGTPQSVHVELSETVDLERYFTESSRGGFLLKFPKVMDIPVSLGGNELRAKVEVLYQVCFHMHQNIASRKSNEYIFKAIDYGPPIGIKGAALFAGSRSVKVFRHNFVDRLAEVFYNLTWLYENQPSEFNETEFGIHEKLLLQIQTLPCYQPLPPYVLQRYSYLKRLIERNTGKSR